MCYREEVLHAFAFLFMKYLYCLIYKFRKAFYILDVIALEMFTKETSNPEELSSDPTLGPDP